MVPMRNPRIVERKVKPMSVNASPVVKKIMSVCQIALGRDQKKVSTKPVSAPISQAAMIRTRMPICTARIAAPGQSRWTGKRRARKGGDRPGALAMVVLAPAVSFTAGEVVAEGTAGAARQGAAASTVEVCGNVIIFYPCDLCGIFACAVLAA